VMTIWRCSLYLVIENEEFLLVFKLPNCLFLCLQPVIFFWSFSLNNLLMYVPLWQLLPSSRSFLSIV
jgi:hypothetical protein